MSSITNFPYCSYSLADRAWHDLRARGEDQAIVLTGESGAGKTEAGKLVMQYIAAVTGHTRECQDTKYQLLQSNPVLEGDVWDLYYLHRESVHFFKFILKISLLYCKQFPNEHTTKKFRKCVCVKYKSYKQEKKLLSFVFQPRQQG